MSQRRSILLIAHGAPPSTLPGARRIAGITRYLAELGHDVTVLSSVMFGRGHGRWGATRVVRTRDLMASPLLERRRRIRNSGPKAEGSTAGPAAELSTSRLTGLFAPDVAVASWLPFALPRALGLAAAHSYDCVITSGPPRSTHLVGLALHARGLPWIADFRDGWTFEAVRPRLSRPAARFDRLLEQLVASRADVVTAVTPSLTDDLATRLGARAVTITNGFDPAESGASEPGASELLAEDRHSLVYTGSLRVAQFGPFGRALASVLQERPDMASRLEVVIVGPRWEGVEGLAREQGLDFLRWLPPLPRSEVLRLQREADSLLVLLEPERPGVVTTKLYEYLAADRPVLVVGPDGDAARILDDAGGGLAVRADPEGLRRGLEALLAGESPPRGRTGRDGYAYPRIAARMAEQIERAIESSRRAEARA